MKYILAILIFFCVGIVHAQQPSIDYLMCDEAKSQLQIHGSFGNAPGTVTIEDTTLGVVSWSDSLIICDLPDSGKGAGGAIFVQTTKGKSNKRVLSVFLLNFFHLKFAQEELNGQCIGSPSNISYQEWKIQFRFDILPRKLKDTFLIPFEISKSSFGATDHGSVFPWADSGVSNDPTIQMSGNIDLKKYLIYFKPAIMHIHYLYHTYDSSVWLPPVSFDSSGVILGFLRDYLDCYCGFACITSRDSLPQGFMLYPPNPKNIVTKESQKDNQITTFVENHSIIIDCSSPLGSTTASLYSIDGRLLKHEKINIDTPGNYTFDASGITPQFGILVLQTPKGVITKKIIFLDLR